MVGVVGSDGVVTGGVVTGDVTSGSLTSSPTVVVGSAGALVVVVAVGSTSVPDGSAPATPATATISVAPKSAERMREGARMVGASFDDRKVGTPTWVWSAPPPCPLASRATRDRAVATPTPRSVLQSPTILGAPKTTRGAGAVA